MIRRLACAASALLILVSCAPPRIDTSTDESLSSSLEKVRAALPEDKRTEFDEAIQELALSDVSLGDLIALGSDTSVETLTSRIKDKLSGKTAEEILAEATRVREERERKQREQALQEIAELAGKVQEAELAKAELAAFEVERSRFYKRKQRFGRSEPVIDLTVKNGTAHAISRAHFRGTLASPQRTIPWLREEFNYQIRGGLEPGEKAKWSLAPNRFSEWGTVDVPPDAVFTVEVIRLDGPDGEALYDAEGISEFEEARLQELREKYDVR